MYKMLTVDHSKCTGCRLCEVVCSVKKTGAVNPARARLAVIKWEQVCVDVPVICQQCESAPCMLVCPVKALTMDEKLNRVAINHDLCIGCRFCMAVCPFGAISLDSVAKKVVKCDLCDGDPTCVRFCETKALQYEDASTPSARKMRSAAKKVLESMRAG
ncbi:MAG: 4Fe-4S dicluster domain-containing protein [Dehalococcoidia bacterium]|nr:4Fe-4S dicluster domain-containing protein [Dehalococcoidia bacterium]